MTTRRNPYDPTPAWVAPPAPPAPQPAGRRVPWLLIGITAPLWLPVLFGLLCLLIFAAPFILPVAAGAFLVLFAVRPRRKNKPATRR